MYYELTLERLAIDQETKLKERYLVSGCDLFAEAECAAYAMYSDCDVKSIKQSKCREIVNETGKGKYFKVIIADTFVTDLGAEKDIKYEIYVVATDLDDANGLVSEYIKQGYNMRLAAIQETRVVGVLNYTNC